MIRKDLTHLPAYASGKSQTGCLKLASNETTQPPAPSAIKAAQQAAEHFNRYPDMGSWDLKEALAEHLNLPIEQIAVGCGSSALCQQMAQMTSLPGDEIIYAWRSFEAYPIFTRVTGATPVEVPLTEDYRHDLPAMAAAITDRTKLIYLCNPNNPTGTTISRAEFTEFMQQVPKDVVVALDEAYGEFNDAEDTPNALEEIKNWPNLVGLRTFSKAYALAGARVGYAFGAPELIEALNKVCIPFSVAAGSGEAAIAALREQSLMQERIAITKGERERITRELGAVPSRTNFVWFPKGDSLPDPLAFAQKLLAEKVIVRPFPEGIRVTVTTPEESEQLLAAWAKAQQS